MWAPPPPPSRFAVLSLSFLSLLLVSVFPIATHAQITDCKASTRSLEMEIEREREPNGEKRKRHEIRIEWRREKRSSQERKGTPEASTHAETHIKIQIYLQNDNENEREAHHGAIKHTGEHAGDQTLPQQRSEKNRPAAPFFVSKSQSVLPSLLIPCFFLDARHTIRPVSWS